MRIVGGAWGGRALTSVGRGDAGAHLRPTSDRVRESLFNLLEHSHGDPADGGIVLDLFGGTGALGLEALSRGAAHATFVENGRAALRILEANIDKLNARADTTVLRRDASKPLPPPSGVPATLIFLDPPYGKGLGARALEHAASAGWIEPGALVVWEENAPQMPPPGLAETDYRRYGDTHITILTALET